MGDDLIYEFQNTYTGEWKQVTKTVYDKLVADNKMNHALIHPLRVRYVSPLLEAMDNVFDEMVLENVETKAQATIAKEPKMLDHFSLNTDWATKGDLKTRLEDPLFKMADYQEIQKRINATLGVNSDKFMIPTTSSTAAQLLPTAPALSPISVRDQRTRESMEALAKKREALQEQERLERLKAKKEAEALAKRRASGRNEMKLVTFTRILKKHPGPWRQECTEADVDKGEYTYTIFDSSNEKVTSFNECDDESREFDADLIMFFVYCVNMWCQFFYKGKMPNEQSQTENIEQEKAQSA